MFFHASYAEVEWPSPQVCTTRWLGKNNDNKSMWSVPIVADIPSTLDNQDCYVG